MNVASCRRLVSLFMYCSVAVLVIVNGQSTTDDDIDKDEIIRHTVEALRVEFRAQQEKLRMELERVKGELAAMSAKKSQERHAAGPQNDIGGSGSNLLCLPEDPQWKNYLNGYSTYSGRIAGVKYEIFNSGYSYENSVFSAANNGGNSLGEKPASCAVCYVGGRSTVLMVPARTQCPDGWTTEYGGYLVSDASHDRNRKRSSYVCLDEAPEVAAGGTSHDQATIYPVEVICETLPCSLYINGRELTCVVCSK